MLEKFSATVGKLYAAAASDLSWRDALVAIEDLTGSTGAVIDLVPSSPYLPRMTFAGSFSEENCLEYARDYQAICPRIRYAMNHPDADIQFDYLFMNETEMDRDPVYEWFGKEGLRYHLGATVAKTPAYRTFWSLQRSKRQGHAQSHDVQLFNLLRPHVERATSLAHQLGALHSLERLGTSILEALPKAVFALSANGRVVYLNGAALELVEKGDGLRIEGALLRTRCSADQARLDQLIHVSAHEDGITPSGWTKASRASGAPAYAVFVAPLRVEDELLQAMAASTLVIVHDPTSRVTPDPGMLSGIYGLTDTEARLASAIAGGHSLESAAVVLNIRTATARSHLKAVFAKLRLNRQQDLVRLLASLSTMRT